MKKYYGTNIVAFPHEYYSENIYITTNELGISIVVLKYNFEEKPILNYGMFFCFFYGEKYFQYSVN